MTSGLALRWPIHRSEHNPNAGVFIFHCTRGAETQTFETVSIVQSAAIALQLLDGSGVIMYTHVEVNGQVVYERPGQAGRTDLWTCSIEGVDRGGRPDVCDATRMT